MAHYNCKVCGEEKEIYIDGTLKKQIDEKVIPRVNTKDNDWVWIVDGEERSGKSVLSQQLAKKVDPTFNIERVTFTPNEFLECVKKASKGQAIVYDEAYTGLSSRSAMSKVNQMLVNLMMEMGQKNLVVIITMPTFFMLDKYIALWRAKGLFHVYTYKGKRGFWKYYNKHKKKYLYFNGKKYYSYYTKTGFKGRFLDQYTVDEDKYREKKAKSLKYKNYGDSGSKFKNQRDYLIHFLKENKDMPYTEISRQVRKIYKWGIHAANLGRAAKKVRRQLKENEVGDE